VFRILDAGFNRAREALRVLEDLARFHHDDEAGARRLKEARHALDGPARSHRTEFLAARDAAGDVGRGGDRPVDRPRPLADVAAANFKRAEEALRTIEETAKGRFPGMSSEAHRLRYGLYEIEKGWSDPRRRLRSARLYVLLDPEVARGPLERVAREALRGGADVLQFRQKPRVDLGLARALRAVARDAIFIVNDRPDLALAAGADYISVGPMFATARKPGLEPRGFEYLSAAKRLGVPFFCIGGITRRNVRRDMERAAVCGGVVDQRDVAGAARAIRRVLTSGR